MEWNDLAIANDPRIALIGRRNEAEDPLHLFWVGSGFVITARFRSLSIRIEADWSDQAPWAALAVDGAPVARFPLRRGMHTYDLLNGMDGETAHRIRLTRDTQPMEGDERLLVRLCRLELDGETLTQPPRRTIEFIGDSLTSGEGLCGPVSAAEWKTAWMSGALTYAAQVCALLDAEGEWVSQSGWGIVTDWTQDRLHTLPRIYGEVCALQEAGHAPYDFTAHPADAVVVNLGTNDMNALGQLPAEEQPARGKEIVTAARSFLRQIHASRPATPVLWVYGMCGGGLNALLEQAVSEARREMPDLRAAFLALPACGTDELGSLGHPGWLSHRKCAGLIAASLKDLIEKPGAM